MSEPAMSARGSPAPVQVAGKMSAESPPEEPSMTPRVGGHESRKPAQRKKHRKRTKKVKDAGPAKKRPRTAAAAPDFDTSAVNWIKGEPLCGHLTDVEPEVHSVSHEQLPPCRFDNILAAPKTTFRYAANVDHADLHVADRTGFVVGKVPLSVMKDRSGAFSECTLSPIKVKITGSKPFSFKFKVTEQGSDKEKTAVRMTGLDFTGKNTSQEVRKKAAFEVEGLQSQFEALRDQFDNMEKKFEKKFEDLQSRLTKAETEKHDANMRAALAEQAFQLQVQMRGDVKAEEGSYVATPESIHPTGDLDQPIPTDDLLLNALLGSQY
jgi:hypothetical protein